MEKLASKATGGRKRKSIKSTSRLSVLSEHHPIGEHNSPVRGNSAQNGSKQDEGTNSNTTEGALYQRIKVTTPIEEQKEARKEEKEQKQKIKEDTKSSSQPYIMIKKRRKKRFRTSLKYFSERSEDQEQHPGLDLQKVYDLCIRYYTNPNSRALSKLKSYTKQIKDSYSPVRELALQTNIRAISSKNNWLCMGSESTTIQVFKKIGKHLKKLQETPTIHTLGITALDMERIRDQLVIISGSRDHTIAVWSWSFDKGQFSCKLQRKLTLSSTSTEISRIKICPEIGKVFILNNAFNSDILVFDIELQDLSLKEAHRVSHSHNFCFDFVISSDGQTLVTGGEKNYGFGSFLKQWSLDPIESDYELKESLYGHQTYVSTLAMSEDSLTMVSGGRDKFVIVWTRKAKEDVFETKQILRGHQHWVNSVSISRDASVIVTGSDDKSVLTFRKSLTKGETFACIDRYFEHEDQVTLTAIWEMDSRGLPSPRSLEELGEGVDREPLHSLLQSQPNTSGLNSSGKSEKNRQKGFLAARIRSEDRMVLSGTGDRNLRIRSLEHLIEKSKASDIIRGRRHIIRMGEYPEYEALSKSSIRVVRIAKDGLLMATLDSKMECRIFEWSQDQGVYEDIQLFVEPRQRFSAIELEISHDSRVIIFVNGNKIIVLQRMSSGAGVRFKRIEDLMADQEKISSIMFVKGTLNFLTGGKDNRIKFWKCSRAGEGTKNLVYSEQRVISGHTSLVSALDVSVDGSKLVSGSWDNTVIVWDVVNPETFECKQLQVLEDDNWIFQTILSRDMQLLITGNYDTSISVYAWDPRHQMYFRIQRLKKVHQEKSIFFKMRLFNNERYLISLADPGTQLKLWSLGPTGLNHIKNLGKAGGFNVEEKSNKMAIVNHRSRNVFTVFKIREKFTTETTFMSFKFFYELFDKKNDSTLIEKSVLQKFLESQKNARGSQYRVGGGLVTSQLMLRPKDEASVNLSSHLSLHSRRNILLLVVLSNYSDLLSKALESFGYCPMLFEETYDPLDIAIKLNHMSCLDAITEYFNFNSTRKNSLMAYLDLERFKNCMKTSSESFRDMILGVDFADPEIHATTTFLEYPLDHNNFKVFDYHIGVYDARLRNRIQDDANHHSKQRGAVSVSYRCFRFKLDSSLSSRSCLQLLEAYHHFSQEMKIRDFRYLIRNIWLRNYRTIMLMASMNFIFSICFNLYMIWLPDKSWVGYSTMAISCVILVYEILNVFKNPSRWSKYPYNYLDLYQGLSITALVYAKKFELLDFESEAVNFWVTLTILLNGFRTLVELRIFDPTRRFIAMITQSVVDMTSFGVTVLFMIVIFSAAHINAKMAHVISKGVPEGAPDLTEL